MLQVDNEFQKAYLMCELAKANSGQDSIKAYEYSLRALSIFKKTKDSLGLGKAYDAYAFVNFDYNKMAIAQANYEKAKYIFERLMVKDSSKTLIDLWSDATMNLAAALGNQGKSREEMNYILEVAPISEKYRNFKISALINSNLGIHFCNEENFEKAYSYFNENDKRYERTKAYPQYAADRLIFASCLMEMDSLETAKKVLDASLKILEKIPESAQWQLYYQSLGEYYSKNGDYDDALKEYAKAMDVINEKKAYGYLAQQYLQYVETYGLMGNTAKQKEYMLKFYKYSKSNNRPDELFALKELAKYEEQAKNYEKALAYLNRYFVLNDTIQQEELSKEIARLEQQYQKERKEREIVELKNKNYEADLNLERKRSQNYLLYFLSGSLLLLSISGYLTYRNRQKKALLKQQQQEQEIQALKSQQERNLFGVMMEGVEQERKRLAADLHDGLGGRLSGISIKLSKLSEVEKVKKIAPELNGILENIDDSLQELRGVARNLMPETLFKYGLKAALEDYCSTLKDKDTNIVLQYYCQEEIEDRNTKLTIYRVIQELINNAVKHARATEILIQFINDGNKIDITVEDDGIGFDETKKQSEQGMGLTNLKNRVNFLDGKMDVRSVLNEGTSINILIEKS